MRTGLVYAVMGVLLLLPGCGPSIPLIEGEQHRSFMGEIRKAVRFEYLLFLPRGMQGEKRRWPLLVFLHGSGESGGDLNKVKVHGPPRMVADQPDFPFILVSPQSPRPIGWSADALNALLDEVVATLPVDTDRVYLTGLSMGGSGTWDLAAAYPHRFAAIAPVCGMADPDKGCDLKEVPVWAFHGAKDNIVPVEDDRKMVEAVRACGGDVKFTVYPDAGHDAWTETYANAELYQWFLSHVRRQQNGGTP